MSRSNDDEDMLFILSRTVADKALRHPPCAAADFFFLTEAELCHPHKHGKYRKTSRNAPGNVRGGRGFL